ncbi:hypothetical protein DV515_00012890 [Chloebia gouldiae]|uniref:Uncharacterized protein n=1 Tax=Chloebia gouldiae TaxID=44316 RepID=A0A3L8S317_CHLGU|nr:hypothetical protein DV515_00012890 [Chloebia gouldiae]
MGRQTMRNYPGLIDSVMTYTQNCVASSRPDDKLVLWQVRPPKAFWISSSLRSFLHIYSSSFPPILIPAP